MHTVAFLSAYQVRRSVRVLLIVLIAIVYAAGIASGVALLPRTELAAALLPIGLLACCGPPGSSTPVATGTVATAGLRDQATALISLAAATLPLGLALQPNIDWLALAHFLAIIDLLAGCVAVTAIIILAQPSATLQQPTISQRAVLALGLLTIVLTIALFRPQPLIVMPGFLGIWIAISEVVAGIVAWQVIRRFHDPSPQQTSRRITLVLSGIAASLALILVPVLLDVGSDLNL